MPDPTAGTPRTEVRPDDCGILIGEGPRRCNDKAGHATPYHSWFGEPVVTRIEAEASGTGLDAAWAAAEAALPEGWLIVNLTRSQRGEWLAVGQQGSYGSVQEGTRASGSGATPPAALRALAARLSPVPVPPETPE